MAADGRHREPSREVCRPLDAQRLGVGVPTQIADLVSDMSRMRARSLLTVGLWASQILGVVALVNGHAVGAALALVVFGLGLHGTRAVFLARDRWRRLRSWPRPGDPELFPAGPRRVLLIETGIVLPGLRTE